MDDEIKKAVDCGVDRSPGPDGFTFRFLRHFWEILADYVMAFVQEFFDKPNFPMGCNSSFVTLIPKVDNPIHINDYRPISLIGLQFKIIVKLLTNRLVPVLHGIIGMEQYAFIKSRQILVGPLMVNELVKWFKKKKKKLMFFKVDFEKAYDSVS